MKRLLPAVALLILVAGCNNKSTTGLVGKWHVVGEVPTHVVEFFADGKVSLARLLDNPADPSAICDYTLTDGELVATQPGKPVPLRAKITFPDNEHMDWSCTWASSPKAVTVTTRFERIPALAAPKNP